ncbi:MAG: hypothetical protein M1118_03640 [Chloroflexi bacterium]|nr:hypothetical protein [Chloroflexota bacterium]
MIIIRPEALAQLRSLNVEGNPAKLEFNAEPDNEGGYNCSVALVADVAPEAEIEDIDGVTIGYVGMANSVFAGSVVGLDPSGELTLEMVEDEAGSCGVDGCGDGGCGSGCSCGV